MAEKQKRKGLFGAIGSRIGQFVGGLMDIASAFSDAGPAALIGFGIALVGIVPALLAGVVVGAVDTAIGKTDSTPDIPEKPTAFQQPEPEKQKPVEPSPEDVAKRSANVEINQLINAAFPELNKYQKDNNDGQLKIVEAKLQEIREKSTGIDLSSNNKTQMRHFESAFERAKPKVLAPSKPVVSPDDKPTKEVETPSPRRP